MNNTIWFNVEICPGADISRAAEDAIGLATKLGVTVWFHFNEVLCGASPNGNPVLLAKNYHAALGSKSNHKMAFSH